MTERYIRSVLDRFQACLLEAGRPDLADLVEYHPSFIHAAEEFGISPLGPDLEVLILHDPSAFTIIMKAWWLTMSTIPAKDWIGTTLEVSTYEDACEWVANWCHDQGIEVDYSYGDPVQRASYEVLHLPRVRQRG